MARPRTSAKLLEIRGAFKNHPERTRADAPGAGPLDLQPPAHLPQAVVPAWRYIVEMLPMVVITKSDRLAIEAAARCLTRYWKSEFIEDEKELRQWLAKLGLTPADRARLPYAPQAPKNPYNEH